MTGDGWGDEAIPRFGSRLPGVRYAPRPGAYAVMFDDRGHVAVVRSGDRAFLPGGGSAEDETPEDTLVREVREECGVTVRDLRRIGAADEFTYAADENEYFRKRCVFFITTIDEDASLRPEEGWEIVWLPPDLAGEALLHGSHGWAVRLARDLDGRSTG